MGKVIFRYGAMGASKTANLIMMRYNYLEKGKKPVLLKSAIDTRDGVTTIKSRMGLEADCLFVDSFIDSPFECDVIIVDEAQFLNTKEVNELVKIADDFDISIVFYGLKTNFRSELFEGSKRIIELADEIEEIPTICWCGKKARFNARIIDGQIVKSGDDIVLGSNELYTALCRHHYMTNKLHE